MSNRKPYSHLYPGDFFLDVQQGDVPGNNVTHKFGRNAAVGTTFVPVAFGGIYRTPDSTGAAALRVKSGGNASDTAAGSGAREITLIGLDENFDEVSEAVATAGASASSLTTTTFTRLYRAYVSASGTYADSSTGSHVGDIVIEDSLGNNWLTIDSTGFPRGQSEVAVLSIPRGKTGYFLSASFGTDATKSSEVLLFARQNLAETAAPYSAMRELFNLTLTGQPFTTALRSPIKVEGPADLGWMAKINTATAVVSIDFEVLIV